MFIIVLYNAMMDNQVMNGYAHWDRFGDHVRTNEILEKATLEPAESVVKGVLFHPPQNMEDPVTIMDFIQNQLRLTHEEDQLDDDEERDTTNDTADLIETLAEKLTSPYARNILGGSLLNELRKKILIPEEHAKLRETLALAVVKCACGHEFFNRESVTWSGDGPLIQCRRCSRPNYVVCAQPGCDNMVLVERDGRIMQPMCEGHQQAAAQEPRAARTIADALGIGDLDVANMIPRRRR
jgi:hypothetical protein